jgi:hypothetical protein
MSNEKQATKSSSDRLRVDIGSRPPDVSATAWLIGEGVRYLNTASKEGEIAYLRIIELLRRCNKDMGETVMKLFQESSSGDAPFRWSLLYILGDAGNAKDADFLVSTALKPLPEAKEGEGCEGRRDTEMLVSTMAVHALQRVAERHPEASEHILKIVSERPARPILIEAVRAASKLRFKEREPVKGLLPKEDYWILDIRQARIEELSVDPERKNVKERGFTPPKMGPQYTAPDAGCCTRKER